jgi:uncharacterized phage-associated protein
MAYPASLIAYAFVKKGINEGKFVTQMKLQKLVYFAQGYHLVKYGKPLINERFEAWKYGPVVPEIYQDFKLYGSKPIVDTHEYMPSFDDDKRPRVNEEAYDAINYTWDVLKDFSALKLSYWTHEADSPWSKFYAAEQRSTPIPNEEIKKYFAELLIKQ